MPYEKVGKNEPVCIADEVPFEIPESWEWVRLSVVNDIYTGNSINGSEKKLKYTGLTSGYYYIGTKDVGFDHTIDYDNGVRIPYGLEKFRVAPQNSILMCIEGGSAGRKISFTNQDVCFGNKLCCFVSLGIEYLFLYYYLQSPLFQAIFKENTTGIIGGVSVNTLKSLFFPIPPLQEQKRIVEKLIQLEPFLNTYAEAEETIEKLNTSFPKLLKKSIIQEAVQGKLVPQNENDEPASVLLDRIRTEKESLIKAGKIKKDKNESVIFRRDNSHYEKLNGIEHCIDDEIPFSIPNSWEWTRISSLGSIIRGRGIKRTETVEYGKPCVRYGEIYTKYHTFFTQTVSFISDELYERCKHFSNGDILMTLTGENKLDIAKTVVYLGDDEIAAGGDLAYWTAHGMNPLYLTYLMASPYAIGRKVELATGDIIVHISGDKLGTILIPIPPLQEQDRIVCAIEHLLSEISTL